MIFLSYFESNILLKKRGSGGSAIFYLIIQLVTYFLPLPPLPLIIFFSLQGSNQIKKALYHPQLSRYKALSLTAIKLRNIIYKSSY